MRPSFIVSRFPAIFARPGFILLVTVFGALATGFYWWPKWQAGFHPQDKAAANRALGEPSPPAANSARKLREFAAYWRKHKARLQQLLTVDYPAALARKNANFPGSDAVLKSVYEHRLNFRQQHREIQRRMAQQEKQTRDKLRENETNHRTVPIELLLYGGWLADRESIADNLTISDLARWHGPEDPKVWLHLRETIAETERVTFLDETAAKQAESLQTSQGMVDYISQAWPRWKAAQERVYTKSGFDAEVSAYLLASACANGSDALSGDLQRMRDSELFTIGRESDAILQGMHEPELAAASRDDPESRRLLTELKELLLMREQQKKEGLVVAK